MFYTELAMEQLGSDQRDDAGGIWLGLCPSGTDGKHWYSAVRGERVASVLGGREAGAQDCYADHMLNHNTGTLDTLLYPRQTTFYCVS